MKHLPTVAELRATKPHLEPVVWLQADDGTHRVLAALQPKQLEAFRLTPLGRPKGAPGPIYLGFGGSAGSGKSLLARTVAVAVALTWPGSRTLILRETDDDVKKNHFQPLRLLLGWMPGLRWNETDLTCLFPNRSVIECGYLRAERDAQRYQGQEYQCIVAEEATLLPWGALRLVLSRLRGGPPGATPFALFPTNPGGPGHAHFKRIFVQRRFREDERPEDYAFVQARLADNTELQQADPSYARKLDLLPEPYRSWQRDGDFSAGAGSALSQIDWRRHLIPRFTVPGYFEQFGSFDWGFAHPFSFGHYAVNEDGTIYKVDTITGHRMLPPRQIERIRGAVPIEKLRYIVAGPDVRQRHIARGENVPTIEEQFAEAGIYLTMANTDRVQGLENLRRLLDWETSGPWVDGKPTEGDPRLLFMDTPGNRRCLEQLEQMVEDPRDPRDVLKVDADDFGEGGDDIYDETRYAVASRPSLADAPFETQPVSAWAPEMLRASMERRRVRERSAVEAGLLNDGRDYSGGEEFVA